MVVGIQERKERFLISRTLIDKQIEEFIYLFFNGTDARWCI